MSEAEKKKYLTATVYFGPDHEKLMHRLFTLQDKYKSVSVSGLIVTAAEACIDTFEKEIPNKRSFKLNGCLITV